MIETVEQPTFRSTDFAVVHKKPGVSALVRLHNEKEFAYASLNSIVPYFDEIVIVFNDCTDRTPDIVADVAAKHPRLVRAFKYVPEVVLPGNPLQHGNLSPCSSHSFVYYCNYALSKASYQMRCKWDGDQIAIPQAMERVVNELRRLRPGTRKWWLSPWRLGYWWFTGLNLLERDQEVYVPKLRPFIGAQHDHGFFPAGRLIQFKRYAYAEYLFTRVLRHRFVGCLFYHVKGLKRDRGVGNYLFDPNAARLPREIAGRVMKDPPLQTVEEFLAGTPEARGLPRPTGLGIAMRALGR